MKVSEFIAKEMAFSHRPQDGISVGVAVIGGVAYMSVGFVRTGDCFNRKLARHILAQRILTTIETDKPVKFVGVVEGLDERVRRGDILNEFRKQFKPDPFCNDATFSDVGHNGNVAVRTPMQRAAQWSKIVAMFDNAVKAARTQCVS